MTKNFFKNQINPFLILRCHKSCCNNKHTTSLIRLFDARLIMKVEEGVVRLTFQNNWFLPKTRSSLNRIVSAQRTCLNVKPEVLVMNC